MFGQLPSRAASELRHDERLVMVARKVLERWVPLHNFDLIESLG